MVSNKLFGLAYNGMPVFKPMEVMWQETSNAVMGALLIHDIRNEKGAANPQATNFSNPLELFSKNRYRFNFFLLHLSVIYLFAPAVW